MDHSQNSMENRRHEINTGEKFSFPIMPSIQDQEFEFGSSRRMSSGSPSSPADHLFFNGRLLPHAFPSQRTSTNHSVTYSRSTSRTSSVSSKDSFMSSRSNSTNSRNSTSTSSARTSTSDHQASEMKILTNHAKISNKIPSAYQTKKPTMLNRQYSSSQMWQFIGPVPVLNHQVSGSRNRDVVESKRMKSKDKTSTSTAWLGKRFFRSFVSACKECHAIKPSSRVDVSCRAI